MFPIHWIMEKEGSCWNSLEIWLQVYFQGGYEKWLRYAPRDAMGRTDSLERAQWENAPDLPGNQISWGMTFKNHPHTLCSQLTLQCTIKEQDHQPYQSHLNHPNSPRSPSTTRWTLLSQVQTCTLWRPSLLTLNCTLLQSFIQILGLGNGHDSDTGDLSCLIGESHHPLLTCTLCILENGGDENDGLCFAQGTHYHIE